MKMTNVSEKNTQMQYLCVLEKTPSGYSAFLADFDLVLATGRTKYDVVNDLAQELLSLARDKPLPMPVASELEYVDEDVELVRVAPADLNPVSMKLDKLMRQEGKKQKDVAQLLGVSGAAVSRLTSPYYHSHTLDSVERLAHALGYEVEVSFKKIHN